MPKLTFCGGVSEVTGANFLYEVAGKRILVDCGMVQGGPAEREENYRDFPYDPSTIDVLLITHAHIDHIGRIPKLVRDGFKGVIYSTPKTREITPYMLEDSSRLLLHEAQVKGIEPLYTEGDAKRAMELWQSIDYHVYQEIAPGISVFLKNSGHILGAAIIEITSQENGKSITTAFTGDLGNTPTPLLPDTEFVTEADYMVMESVYGDRNHPDLPHRKERFLKAIQDAIARGGTILVPMFSLEKTQVVLHELNGFVEGGLIPHIPIYLDSPLAIKVTEIYRKSTSEFNAEAQAEIKGGDDIFDFPGLEFVGTSEESKNLLHATNPKMLIAGAGMSSGGRVVGHESALLPNPRNTVLFLGYQGAGTLGRQLEDGNKTVTIFNQKIAVQAHIETIDGYSSHKDSDALADFAAHASPRIKKIFVCMGEPKSALFLTQKIRDNFNIDAVHPEEGQSIELE